MPATDWDTALQHLDWTYFALLGGPYASLVLAKAAVTVRVNNGSLQKTLGERRSSSTRPDAICRGEA